MGDVRRDDALARQARVDSDAAGDDLLEQTCGVVLDDSILGAQTLGPGVYCFASPDVQLRGTLILDTAGDPAAVWIFRIAGTLTTTPDAAVLVTGGGYDGNVFWWTGGAASLGVRTRFIGNIFTRTNIALDDGASISGRAFALTGSVTLHGNRVSLCCAPLLLAPASLPNGAPGTPYRVMLAASGGLAPYTFTISSGKLPAGLALASDGILQGTPARPGIFRFTVTATDALGCSGSAAYTIRIERGAQAAIPTMSPWMLFAVSILLAGAGWIAIGRR